MCFATIRFSSFDEIILNMALTVATLCMRRWKHLQAYSVFIRSNIKMKEEKNWNPWENKLNFRFERISSRSLPKSLNMRRASENRVLCSLKFYNCCNFFFMRFLLFLRRGNSHHLLQFFTKKITLYWNLEEFPVMNFPI